MKKYFEVVAKCGHVGRGRYYEGHFFLQSYNMSNAAQFVKTFPRVKKDHDDAILAVYEVTKEEFEKGREREFKEVYFKCNSKHEQNENWEEIKQNVKMETESQLRYRELKGFIDRERNKKKKNKNGIRNPYKYAKYHQEIEIEDYELAI